MIGASRRARACWTVALSALGLAACSKDSASATREETAASRPPPREVVASIPEWLDFAPTGAHAIAEVSFDLFYESSALRERGMPRSAENVARLEWLQATARACELRLPNDLSTIVWASYPSGSLFIVTGEFEATTMSQCVLGLDTTAPQRTVGGTLAVHAAERVWLAVPEDGALVASRSLESLTAALSSTTARLARTERVRELLDEVPTHHAVRVAWNFTPESITPTRATLDGLLERPPTSTLGWVKLDDSAEYGFTIELASEEDAHTVGNDYRRRLETPSFFVTVVRNAVVLRGEMGADDFERMWSFLFAAGPSTDAAANDEP